MHRLRDLDRRQALVAAALLVLLLVPFAASLARAHHTAWIPSGDDALIGLRSRDVFSSHRPKVGQPSTSHLYGNQQGTSHPGPIEFYWLAIPIRVLGPAVGMALGAALFNLISVLVASWVVFRRAGPTVAAWAMVVMGLVLWSSGTAILSDPISSSAGGIPLLALAAIAWALADGDLRLLPLGAVFGSWVAQQHLAIVVPAASMVALGAGGAAVHGVLRWRAARASRADGDADVDPAPVERTWPWAVGALAICLVLWSTVLLQQVTGNPGNITAVIRYAQSSETKALGWVAALRQAARAVGFPPLLLRSDLQGDAFFRGPLRPYEVVVAVASYAALVAIAVVCWGRRRTLSLLAVTTLVLAAAGTYNGTTIPDSIEAFRTNFYRWAFVVAWLAWIAFGWAGALVARHLWARAGRQVPAGLIRLGPALAAVALLIPAVATSFTAGFDDERRDQSGFHAFRAMAAAAVDEAGRSDAGRVTLVTSGRSAILASGSAVALQLEDAGHPVLVPGQEARFWGHQRILHPGQDPGDLVLQLLSGRGSVPAGPGRVIAHYDLNEELRKLVAPVERDARSGPPVLSDQADEILARNYKPDQYDYVRGLMADLQNTPAPVLTDDRLLSMVADGYYASPTFDARQIRALQAAAKPVTVNEDDVFELRVLTRAELGEVVR